jgi:hypothetical protein
MLGIYRGTASWDDVADDHYFAKREPPGYTASAIDYTEIDAHEVLAAEEVDVSEAFTVGPWGGDPHADGEVASRDRHLDDDVLDDMSKVDSDLIHDDLQKGSELDISSGYGGEGVVPDNLEVRRVRSQYPSSTSGYSAPDTDTRDKDDTSNHRFRLASASSKVSSASGRLLDTDLEPVEVALPPSRLRGSVMAHAYADADGDALNSADNLSLSVGRPVAKIPRRAPLASPSFAASQDLSLVDGSERTGRVRPVVQRAMSEADRQSGVRMLSLDASRQLQARHSPATSSAPYSLEGEQLSSYPTQDGDRSSAVERRRLTLAPITTGRLSSTPLYDGGYAGGVAEHANMDVTARKVHGSAAVRATPYLVPLVGMESGEESAESARRAYGGAPARAASLMVPLVGEGVHVTDEGRALRRVGTSATASSTSGRSTGMEETAYPVVTTRQHVSLKPSTGTQPLLPLGESRGVEATRRVQGSAVIRPLTSGTSIPGRDGTHAQPLHGTARQATARVGGTALYPLGEGMTTTPDTGSRKGTVAPTVSAGTLPGASGVTEETTRRPSRALPSLSSVSTLPEMSGTVAETIRRPGRALPSLSSASTLLSEMSGTVAETIRRPGRALPPLAGVRNLPSASGVAEETVRAPGRALPPTRSVHALPTMSGAAEETTRRPLTAGTSQVASPTTLPDGSGEVAGSGLVTRKRTAVMPATGSGVQTPLQVGMTTVSAPEMKVRSAGLATLTPLSSSMSVPLGESTLSAPATRAPRTASSAVGGAGRQLPAEDGGHAPSTSTVSRGVTQTPRPTVLTPVLGEINQTASPMLHSISSVALTPVRGLQMPPTTEDWHYCSPSCKVRHPGPAPSRPSVPDPAHLATAGTATASTPTTHATRGTNPSATTTTPTVPASTLPPTGRSAQVRRPLRGRLAAPLSAAPTPAVVEDGRESAEVARTQPRRVMSFRGTDEMPVTEDAPPSVPKVNPRQVVTFRGGDDLPEEDGVDGGAPLSRPVRSRDGRSGAAGRDDSTLADTTRATRQFRDGEQRSGAGYRDDAVQDQPPESRERRERAATATESQSGNAREDTRDRSRPLTRTRDDAAREGTRTAAPERVAPTTEREYGAREQGRRVMTFRAGELE